MECLCSTMLIQKKNLLFKTGIWAFHSPTRKISATLLSNIVALRGCIKVQEENIGTSKYIHSFLLCNIWYLLNNVTYRQAIEYNDKINACELTYVLECCQNCLRNLYFHLSPPASTDPPQPNLNFVFYNFLTSS